MSTLLEQVAEATKERGEHGPHHAIGMEAARKAWHLSAARGATNEEAKVAAEGAYADAVLAEATAAARPQVGTSAPSALAGPSATASASGATMAPQVAQVEGGTMDAVGRARSEADLAMALEAGFAPAAPIYERGTRVIQAGVDGARASRLEWEAKPLVTEACADLVQRITDERRLDRTIEHQAIGMAPTGQLLIAGDAQPLAVPSRDSFFQLVTRLGYGGGAYLEKCPPALRAANVNSWRAIITEHEAEALAEDAGYTTRKLVARTRQLPGKGGRESFAFVSEGYAPFDADKIATAIARAVPPEARGAVSYDGIRTRFEALFQTTVQPEGFVAGEFFRAGVVVGSGDSGGNSVVIRAVVWMNKCLNMMVIDECTQPIASIRHTGTVMELARRFTGAFRQALKAIEPFQRAWGYARKEDVVERARGTTDTPIPTRAQDAIAGIFAGLLDRKVVNFRGRSSGESLQALVRAWEADDSSATTATRTSRAAVTNAITRAAHEWGSQNPWAEDELQLAAGGLLWGRKGRPPAPLVWVDPETLDARRPANTATT